MYRLSAFDGVTLPRASAEADMSTAGTRAAVIAYAGGVYDGDGTGRAQRELPYQVTLKAELIGSDLPTLRNDLDILRAKRGEVGHLVRTALDDGAEHWCTARLLGIKEPRNPRNVYVHQVEFSFLVMSPWYGVYYTASTPLAASPTNITLGNFGSAPITDPVIKITAGPGGALSGIQVLVSGVSSFTYTGTIAASKILTIDCGAWTVQNNGVDDGDNFHFDAGQTIPDILRIERGGTTVSVYATGTEDFANLEFDYYETWE
jgi:hypothetical protein